MKSLIFYILLCCVPTLATAQKAWLKSDYIDGEICCVDQISNQRISSNLINQQNLNFYPLTPSFDNEPFELKFGIDSSFLNCTIFCVFEQSRDEEESILWKLESSNKDKLIGSNERIADMQDYSFFNYKNNFENDARLISYQHIKNGFFVDRLSLNSMPRNPEIHLGKGVDALAEILIFNKPVSPKYRQMIESYLGLKYSITLNSNYTFDGHTNLWHKEGNIDYHYHVAGLGRSAVFSWNQKQTKSNFEDGTISIGLDKLYPLNALNPNELSEGEFFIWGDNNAVVNFEPKFNNVDQLTRTWKAEYQLTAPRKFTIEVDHQALLNDLKKDEVYWLVMDSDASFKVKPLYYPMYVENNRLVINNLMLEGAGPCYFTIVRGEDFLAQVNIISEDCNSNSTELMVRVFGGNPPYELKFIGQKYTFESEISLSVDKHNFGIQTMVLTDSENEIYTKKIYINSSEFDDLQLPIELDLEEHISISELISTLKIPDDVDFEIVNDNDENFSEFSSELQEGDYTLRLLRNGCEGFFPLRLNINVPTIQLFKIYPNPVSVGQLVAYEFILNEVDSSILTLYSVSGDKIFENQLDYKKYSVGAFEIREPGSYILELRSGASIAQRKIIAVR